MICNDNTAVQKNYNDTALVFIGYYYRLLFVGLLDTNNKYAYNPFFMIEDSRYNKCKRAAT